VTLAGLRAGIGGWLSATGSGLDHPDSVGRAGGASGAFCGPGAHLGGGFSLELEAGATVPLVERRFTDKRTERTVGVTLPSLP
jgi:hypothetical protein